MKSPHHSPSRDLFALVEELARRCVRATRHPSVFTVGLRSLLFLSARVERGRRLFVEAVRQRFPHGLLSLPDWDGEDWRDLGEQVRCGEGQIGVKLGRGLSTDDLLTQLHEGGWVLVLFEVADELEGATLARQIPTDGPGLFASLQSLGAAALISSWYHDRDWTVALEPAR